MYFYRVKDKVVCAWEKYPALPEADGAERKSVAAFLYARDPERSRASFAVSMPELLFAETDDAGWLSARELRKAAAHRAGADPEKEKRIPEEVLAAIGSGTLRGVNTAFPGWEDLCGAAEPFIAGGAAGNGKKRVNILAIGDVGSHLLTGLHLLGGDCIDSIGICDIDEKVTKRWEFEENQIAWPWDYDALPRVDIITKEQLFDGDVFVFVASGGIPPVGSGVKDVRMYQLEKNTKIISEYARMARDRKFRGLFCEISDPVDPLARAAYLASNRDENGVFDGRGLRPEQIQGFGLGVMNARAAYYAKKDPRFKRFLTEGRSFGPHGQELVIADSVANYDDALSAELTKKVVEANLEMRELGFKPFVAPAYSSAALSILLTLRGQWHCGSVFLGGIYMGVKNRYTRAGLEHEILDIPDALMDRIRGAEAALHAVN